MIWKTYQVNNLISQNIRTVDTASNWLIAIWVRQTAIARISIQELRYMGRESCLLRNIDEDIWLDRVLLLGFSQNMSVLAMSVVWLHTSSASFHAMLRCNTLGYLVDSCILWICIFCSFWFVNELHQLWPFCVLREVPCYKNSGETVLLRADQFSQINLEKKKLCWMVLHNYLLNVLWNVPIELIERNISVLVVVDIRRISKKFNLLTKHRWQ